MTTILSVEEFKQYTTNYYLGHNNSYFTTNTSATLLNRIAGVETSLNAMLNGKLYQKYNPLNLVFNGTHNLTPQLEKQTLLICLTKCVEYNYLTGAYVNLNNSYSGNVNGNNNYSANNSNVVGLRNDIRDMLYTLGLYNNVITPNVSPSTTLYENANNVFNNNDLYKVLRAIAQSNLTFTGTITFEDVNNIYVGSETLTSYIQSLISFPYSTILKNYITNNQVIPYLTNNNITY